MDFLPFILLALAIPVAGVAGFFMALHLRSRTSALEQRLALMETRLKPLLEATRREAASDVVRDASAAAAEAPPAEEIPPVQEVPPVEAESFPAAVPEAAPAAPPSSVPPVPPAPPRPRKAGLEEQLGTRWAVWVGGLALGLGGLFLVRYSIEQGLLGPGARVTLGVLFALALLAAGEMLRRRETAFNLPAIKSAHIPGVLTAAGTSTAFATAYASYALYGMIPPAAAFVLLGLIALVTLLAATLHGPALGALGLLAALGCPLLVESEVPRLWPVVLYLGFVVAAAYGVARLRLWRWLAVAASAGAVAWTLVLMAADMNAAAPIIAHVLLQSALAGALLVAEPYRHTPDADSRPDPLANGVFLAFALAAILVSTLPGAGSARPLSAGAEALLRLALAWRFPAFAAGAPLAALVTVGAQLVWPAAVLAQPDPPTLLPDPISVLPRPQALDTYLAFATITALGIAGASVLRLARGRTLPLATAGFFAVAATVGPLLALVVAYLRVMQFDRSLPFALAAGLLALGFAGAAGWLRRQEGNMLDAIRLGLGATAAAAVAALALGLALALERGMLTVAFALAALGTAWIADRLRIGALRPVVGALALLVLGRLIWDPTLVRGDLGRTPVFNWLLWGYGVPAVSFFVAARILERDGRDIIVRLVESLAIACAAFLVIFEIRHALNEGDPLRLRTSHLESGLLATAGLIFSLVLLRVNERRSDVVYQAALLIFSGGSLVTGVVSLALADNPLFSGERVIGGAVFNSLFAAYLLPAILAGALAWEARRSRPRWYQGLALVLAGGLQFLYVILEVRRLFQGPSIDLLRPTGEAELWAYSAALLAVGIALLAIGLLRDVRLARIVSAAYIVAAVGKVFLVDLANLEGVMQALSFIGLGLTLVGIGLAYQRLLARDPTLTVDPPEAKPAG